MATEYDAASRVPQRAPTLERAAAERATHIPEDWKEQQMIYEQNRVRAEEAADPRRREVMLLQHRRAAEAHDRASRRLIGN
eukprot:scaffold4161_cov22-Prasinocladus_malaysianus.AAC.4